MAPSSGHKRNIIIIIVLNGLYKVSIITIIIIIINCNVPM